MILWPGIPPLAKVSASTGGEERAVEAVRVHGVLTLANVLGKVLVLLMVVSAAAWWSFVHDAAGPAATVKAENESSLPVTMKPLPSAETIFHGISCQIHHSHDCVNRMGKLLTEISDLGADAVLISNPGYQEHAGSETFKIDPAVTPSEEQWLRIFQMAHERGLRVVLMPIILLSNPRGSEWRGVISPPSWDDWFDQYRDFLLHFARIAQKGKVEVMAVGSELISTEKYTDRWRRLIKEVRKVYNGKLSYSANWDHYKVVEFWDDLDLVGMTSYYKLSDDPRPSLASLIDAWKPIQRGILRWQKSIGKPLVFTEVGWCSQEGASIEPWNYYHKQDATEAGREEQLNCYKAFMEVWSGTPEVGGVFWWEWNDTVGGKTDYNYTPRGKPAELALRQWFQSARQSASLTGIPAAKTGQHGPAGQTGTKQ